MAERVPYQKEHFLAGFMGDPAGHRKARLNSCMFFRGTLQRDFRGEWRPTTTRSVSQFTMQLATKKSSVGVIVCPCKTVSRAVLGRFLNAAYATRMPTASAMFSESALSSIGLWAATA